MHSPRILFVLDYYLPHCGWLETVFANLIEALQKKGITVGIITTRHTPTLPSHEHLNTITIRRGGSGRRSFLRFAFWKTLRLWSKYDLIHTTTYAWAIPAFFAAKLLCKPLVITIHEMFGSLRKKIKPITRPVYRWVERAIARLYKNHPYTIAVSEYTQHCLCERYGFSKKNLHHIYNGVDPALRTTDNIDPAQTQQFLKKHALQQGEFLLYTWHPGISKGLREFIYAVPTLLQKNQALTIVLNLLPGKQRKKFCSLITKLNIHHACRILYGVTQRELLTIICCSKAVVVPSLSEGFGLIAAEVSHLDHPLIVSANGALPEVVSWKVVFLEGHAPDDFATAVEKIQQGRYAVLPSKQFSRHRMSEAYYTYYQSMLEKKH